MGNDCIHMPITYSSSNVIVGTVVTYAFLCQTGNCALLAVRALLLVRTEFF
jgi:hypothetical protein